MKIAFVTEHNPKSKLGWSGIVFYMYKSLIDANNEVVHISSIKKPYRYVLYIENFVRKLIKLKPKDTKRNVFLCKQKSKNIEKQLKNNHFDVILAVTASSEIAYIKTNIPIVYTTDATFDCITGYYDSYSIFSKQTIDNGNLIESLALNNATKIVYPSEWAKKSAIEFYNIHPAKIKIISFGANLDTIPIYKKKTIESDESINLLFLGVDWKRKGGSDVYLILKNLIKKHPNIYLTICGCTPTELIAEKNIEVIPFLNKNDKNDLAKFENIMSKTHFLILPTKKECFGIVFCEASAYGIPSFSYDTGGISGAISENINGHIFPLSSEYTSFSNKISYYISNPKDYCRLSKSSRLLYETTLNWQVWALNMNQTFAELIKR